MITNKRFNINTIVYYSMAVICLVHAVMLRFVPTTPQIKSILFLLYTLVFIFLIKRSRYIIVDLALIVMSVVPNVYLLSNYTEIMRRAIGTSPFEWVCAWALVIAVIEATRRTIGLSLVVISVIFLIYGFTGPFMPGFLWHRGLSINRFAQNMYISTGGLFGSPMQTAATIIVAFFLMGEIMLTYGAGEFITKLARKATGNMLAGNAKMSTIVGLMFGMISGSAAAIVATTGKITIPLMRKEGFSKEYAAAVAAAAATGGPLAPPVMGAGAFLVAEYCRISYSEVCYYAIVPALFYYLSILICVHYKAKKSGLKPPSELEAPQAEETTAYETGKKQPVLILEYIHIAIPLIVLIVIITLAYPVLFSCFICMAMMMILAIVNPYCKVTIRSVIDTLSNALKGCLGVSIACACSGIIVSVISTTGLGLAFTSYVLSGGISMMVALFLTMLILFVLGMGLPGIAAYIVGASVVISVLTRLNVPLVSAHLFVYYFSCLAVLTPPVALTAFAAAGIAESNPVKTGYIAVSLAAGGFIVPYVWILDPAVILQGDLISCIYRIALTAVGVFGIALGITGYFKNNMSLITRALMILGGLSAVYPSTRADIIGVILVALGIAVNILLDKPRLAVTV